MPLWRKTSQIFKSSSSSSSFIIPTFPLLGLDVIWVVSTVFYPLPYLLWCLTFSCLLPLPYSRSSLAYTSLLPSTSSSISFLSMLLWSLCFTWLNYLNLIFPTVFKVLPPTSYPLLSILPLLDMKSHHQDSESCPHHQTIFFYLKSLWRYHNSRNTHWTSKVISCSSQISEPQTYLVAPPFTTLTPYWVCCNFFAANPTWVPSPLWPNSRISTHRQQLGLTYFYL